MGNKTKVIIAAVALLGAFAAGRWAAPEKVKVEKVIVEVEKKTSEKDAKKSTKKTTTTTKITHPDGRIEESTTVVEETVRESSKSETTDKGKTESETTEITRSSSRVTVSGLGAFSLSNGSGPIYGASITKPILGPITVGAFYLTPGILGGSLGLTF